MHLNYYGTDKKTGRGITPGPVIVPSILFLFVEFTD
jgi:hypothetical protein